VEPAETNAGVEIEERNLRGRTRNEITGPDTTRMEPERDAMNRLFWNQGGTYIHAEAPAPHPALGRVNLEHDAPVPRHPSEEQHRVAVAVEPIPPLDGITIDGEDLVAARKRRREDQQRRLR
jgi:hypothetical protein